MRARRGTIGDGKHCGASRAARRLAGAALLVLVGALGGATPAWAAATGFAAAPGRVVFSGNGGLAVSAAGGGLAVRLVALPDGGAVVAGALPCRAVGSQPASCPGTGGLAVARLTASGALAASFGDGGVARISTGPSPLIPLQLLDQPDGRIVVVASDANPLATNQLLVIRLTQDGRLDPTFGAGGVTTLAIAGYNRARTAAVAADGGIVVTGAVGTPGVPESFRWIVARLTPTGAYDGAFGVGGVLTFGPLTGSGVSVAGLPGGGIVALGRVEPPGNPLLPLPLMLLTRLTATGAADPSFNGGSPAVVPAGAIGSDMLVEPNGSIYLEGGPAVIRFTAAGVLDPGFGQGGIAHTSLPVGVQLLPTADGGVLALGAADDNPGALSGVRVGPDGAVAQLSGSNPGQPVYNPDFGGGSTSSANLDDPAPGPIQDSFSVQQVAERPDGSLLVAGGVSVARPTSPPPPTGSGAGPTTFDLAVAGVTSAFAADPGFGAPASSLGVRLGVARQRLATARARRAIGVTVDASTPGLAQVTVRAGSRVIAQGVLAIPSPGPHTLSVPLTATGRSILRSAGSLRVRASADVHDLLRRTAMRVAARTLRR